MGKLNDLNELSGLILAAGVPCVLADVPRPKGHRDGCRLELSFANGYGASIINGWGAYGDDDNPFELAVLKGGELCYTTHITNNVLGHLSADEVIETLQEIANLIP